MWGAGPDMCPTPRLTQRESSSPVTRVSALWRKKTGLSVLAPDSQSTGLRKSSEMGALRSDERGCRCFRRRDRKTIDPAGTLKGAGDSTPRWENGNGLVFISTSEKDHGRGICAETEQQGASPTTPHAPRVTTATRPHWVTERKLLCSEGGEASGWERPPGS